MNEAGMMPQQITYQRPLALVVFSLLGPLFAWGLALGLLSYVANAKWLPWGVLAVAGLAVMVGAVVGLATGVQASLLVYRASRVGARNILAVLGICGVVVNVLGFGSLAVRGFLVVWLSPLKGGILSGP
jgi:hypothetical protein